MNSHMLLCDEINSTTFYLLFCPDRFGGAEYLREILILTCYKIFPLEGFDDLFWPLFSTVTLTLSSSLFSLHSTISGIKDM